MCCEFKDILCSLINAVNSTDWYMFGITVISVFISALLSYMLYNLTKQLGEQQNAIQQNNLRIQMHKEYFEIYDALVKDLMQINSLEHKFENVLKGICGHNVGNSEIWRILPRAKQLLPTEDYDTLSEFARNYHIIHQNTQNLYGYVNGLEDMHKGVLKHKLTKENIQNFLEELYDIVDYPDVDSYMRSIGYIKMHITDTFIEKMRKYSDLSDIIRSN